MVLQEFVLEKHAVNTNFYENVLKCSLLRTQRVHPRMYKVESGSLLHDNTRLLTAIPIHNFLSQRRVTLIARLLLTLLVWFRRLFVPSLKGLH
ncbi:hypothetical protein TNCT_723581 [Trichonephila clavata]|uniref:Uncharacterized protein n=1 Tax=Trichonephila clavata TaxID=2740835 RepID=A0A8X6FMV7_TRICU|nr:hypothetical protein TNCT_723581 [Trichonephila clavata]